MKTNLATQVQEVVDDIRGIKPPIDIPGPWPWLWIGLTVLALVAAGLAIGYFLRKKKTMALLPPPVPPHVRAKQKLAEALMFISDSNRFCTEVSNTLRLYLEERFNLRAPERTTEEFLVELRTSKHLTIDQKQSLGEFLESCDLVKFARFEPNETTLRRLHDAALRLVDETQFDPINASGASTASGDAPPSPPPLPPGAGNSSGAGNRASEIANRK
jgi:hypothetical protein